MFAPEPDSDTIDAWLAGELPEKEAAAVEQWFDEHPDRLPVSSPMIEGILLDDLTTEEHGPQVNELINRIKTCHPAPEQVIPSSDGWKEVLEPSEDPELLGTIGDYEVLEVIATGGMGIVLRARDPKLDRIAALKVLAPELAANATARERFLREAKAAAKLEHENILSIFGVHEAGVPYFAMRHAPGGTLQDRLDAGEDFGIEQLKFIAREVASALQAAHERGIVHRDIKPANILFDKNGEQLWVCDFGIARSTEDPSLTYPGAIAGTPQFMSPEQAAGGELDGRSDLFSLGAVLHRCATGHFATAGDTTAAVLGQLGSDQPTTIARPREKLPPWFERLLENLLAKDLRDRPRNAEEVIQSIDEQHSPIPKHTARRRRIYRRVAAGAAALALVISGSIFIPKGIDSYRESHPFMTAAGKRFRTLSEAVRGNHGGEWISIHHDGPIPIQPMAWSGDLSIRAADGRLPFLVAHALSENRPFWSGDGKLTLKRLGLQYVVTKETPPPFYMTSGSRTAIHNCRLTMKQVQNKVTIESDFRPLIELRAPGEVLLERSLVIGSEMTFLQLTHAAPAPTRITVRENFFYSRAIVDLSFAKDSVGAIQIDLRNNAIKTSNSFMIRSPNETERIRLPPIQFSAENNLFGSRHGVFLLSESLISGNGDQVTWFGRENLYVRTPFCQIVGSDLLVDGFPSDSSEWKQFYRGNEEGSATTSRWLMQFHQAVANDPSFAPLIKNPGILLEPQARANLNMELLGPNGVIEESAEESEPE